MAESNQLLDRCRAFVEEQSCGEWDDKTINEDAAKLLAFVRREARADLVEPLVEALRKAEELYQVGLLNASDGLANEVVALRRAALSSWEDAQ